MTGSETLSDHVPDEWFVREAAIALLARDALLGHDCRSADDAVVWARKLMETGESSPHAGDCTKQPFTCHRCVVVEAMREARELHND